MPQRVVIPGGFVQVPPTRLILPGGFTQVPFRPVLGGVAKMNPATFVGPLDAYSADLQVALLPFRGFTAYAGQWCRIRESGGDTEADIGYLPDGEPDTAAWAAFVGANDGFLRMWYDQSSGARDGVEADPAVQPQSVLNVVSGYPVARVLEVVSSRLVSTIAASTTRSLYLVAKKRSAQTNVGILYAGGITNSGAFQVDNNAPALGGTWGYRGSGATTSLDVGGAVADWTMCTAVINSAAAGSVWINNNAPTNFDPINGVTTATAVQVGAGAAPGDADVACLLLYNANHDDATREAIQSILAARFGITLAP